jgi:hypothetical protein
VQAANEICKYYRTDPFIKRLACLLFALLCLVIAGVGLVWIFDRPPVDMAKLLAIKKGATQREVETVLGKPTKMYETNRKWAYSRPLGWSIVYVWFDDKGGFERFVYDY